MTDEEREKAREQLKALNQAYNELSQHCSDHNNSAEEVGLLAFSSIACFLLGNGATCCPVARLTVFPPCSVSSFVCCVFFTALHWIRAGDIETVEEHLSMLQTCFSLPTFGLTCYRGYCSCVKLKIRTLNVTNHHPQTTICN